MKQMMRVAAMGIAGLMALSAIGDPYIETDGSQVINTKYFVKPTTRVEVDYAMLNLLTAQQRVFGCLGNVVFQHYINGAYGYSFALQNSSGDWLTVRPDNVQIYATADRRRFVLDAKNKLASFYTGGALVTSRATKTVTNTANFPLALFATCNNATCTAFADQKGKLRLFSFKIFEDDVLAMELLPCREGTTYGLKDTVTGQMFFPHVGNPLTGGNLGEEDPDTVVIAPGHNVTTNGPQVLGPKNVQINETGSGGIVKMNPYSGYTGETRLMCGTLWTDNLPSGGVGSLGGSPTLVLGPGTFRYDGPDGGLWSGTVTNTTGKNEATVIDAQHDFTMQGKWGWETGGFVKTGPGTLTLKNTAGDNAELARDGTAVQGRINYQTLNLHPNGDAPTAGFAKLTVAEGTLVFGGGNWRLNKSVTGEDVPLFAMVGTKTVDPVDTPNVQEKEATLRVDSGTVWFCGWFGLGVKNGFSTTTPDFVPTSKLIINGGSTYITNQLVVGYNSNTITEKDAQGRWIPFRTTPRVEVHGGSLRVWSQLRMCDSPGTDCSLFIDGGNLTVRHVLDTSGSHIRFASNLSGDPTLPRHADVTVCTNGCLDITQFFINNDRTNVTVNLNVLDGGRFRNNQMRLADSQGRTKNCEMNVLVDGGVLELRWGGYKDWIKGDVTSARIGTRGATFKANGCDVNVRDEIHVSFMAADTHPDEEAKGVTVNGASNYNSGFRFFLPQYWAGPTRITSNGICELADTAAFPTATDLTLDGTGRLALTNGVPHAVNSFTLGAAGSDGTSELWLAPGTSIQAGAFGVAGTPTLAVRLCTAAGVTNTLATAGTYTLMSGPVSAADDLREIARRAVIAVPADDTAYEFGVTVDGNVAALTVTVGATTTPATTKAWGNAQGGNWSEGANWTDGAEASGAGAVAAFTTEAAANDTAVNVDAAKTVGGLTFATANAYALSGSALTLDNGAKPAEVKVTAGGPTVANALVLATDANLNTVGGSSLALSGAVTGTGVLTANADGGGSGEVSLGNSLDGFGGKFTFWGGTTHLSSLAFAAARPAALELGWGTLDYTGTGETIAGLTLNPGETVSSVLRIANDLTLTSLGSVPGSGGLIKKGPGDLIFKGNGTFAFNNFQRDYVRTAFTDRQGISATGEPVDSALTSMLVSEGRLVIGTMGDDSDAPTVTSPQQLQVGGRTVDWNSGTNGIYETSGEIVMNNGTVDVQKLWLGYYCGMPGSVDPENLPRAKLTVNGGTINAVNLETLRDWQGFQSVQAEIVQNGGEIHTTGNMVLSYQQTTNGATSSVTVNGGLFESLGHIFMGNDGLSGTGTFTLNGGEVRCDYFRVGCNASSGRQELYLNGGTLYCRILDHIGLANATDAGSAAVYFRGGVVKLGYRRNAAQGLTLGGSNAKNQFEAYVGAAGAVLDFTEWEKSGFDTGILEFRNKFLHDPDCAGEDGGILLTGRTTVIFRDTSKGSTFTGPVRAANGMIIGVDNGWTDFMTKRFIVEASCGLRASGGVMGFKDITFGTAGATEPVVLDCVAGTQNVGVSASESVAVLSPVTVMYHRGGGACNTEAIQDGTYPVLYYQPGQEANVPLDMFVAHPSFPEKSFTYVKEDVASGTYAGWRVVKVTIAPTAANATVWTSVSAGGDWSESANWNGGVPPNGTNSLALFNPAAAANVPVNVDSALTVGTATLKGENAGAGYTVSGGAVNFNHRDFKTAPGFTIESGTHVIANDLTTDDVYIRSNETDVNGGHTGAIGIYTASGATARVTGTVTMDKNRALRVNTPLLGGGKTVLEGPIAQGGGAWVNSGTLEMGDVSTLEGKTLTIGPGTFHYTGPSTMTSMKVTTNPGNNNYYSIMRLDNDLTVYGRFESSTGGFVKRGPGTLTISSASGLSVTNRIGYQGRNTSWNSTGSGWYWPNNGDCSKAQGAGSLCIDEGEVRLAGPNSLFHIANNGNALDCFVGTQDRGWGYATNYAALTILSGTVRGPWLFLGHTFNHGKDANGHLIPTYSVYNQYGGNVTFSTLCFCYDLSDYDTACQATANLYGGTLNIESVMRFGQTYNKTGVNPPHATFNLYGGTYNHTDTSGTKGTRMGYLGDKAGGQKTLDRACDATLNMYGGEYNEVERIHMGCNATTSRLNLHGGVLKAENIFLNTSTSGNYCFFSGGKAYIYWNGGTYAPVGTTAANQVLTNLTEVLVSTNGAVVTTEYLAGNTYTIAQPLLHEPDLEGTDGGFVKKGAKTLALTGANTYTGDTVVEEGTLTIPVGADASALPLNSAVVVAEDATLEMASGTAAHVGALRFDMDTTSGTLAGFAPAASGALYVTGVGETQRKGLVLPVTVTNAQRPNNLTRWAVYVDGDLDDRLSAYVRNNTIVLDAKQGQYLIIR